MNKIRKEMIENGQNLSWCVPMKHKTENIYLVVNENNIDSILDNGKETLRSRKTDKVIDEKINVLAQRLNPEYDEYEGWNDTHILIDSGFEELGCKDCPWFNSCDAMNDE